MVEVDRRPVVRSGKEEKPRKGWKKRVLIGASAITAGALVLPPAINHDNTERVWDALTGQSVNCVDSRPANNGYPADVIAVPGATSTRTREGLIPNGDEQIRLSAAVIEFADGKASQIVLLGKPSHVDAQQHVDAEEKYMKTRYKQLTGQELPSESVVSEMSSTSTKENMEQLSTLMKGKGKSVAEIVTNDYHNGRTIVLACESGVNAFGMPAEDIIQKRRPDWLKKLTANGKNKGDPVEEKFEVFTTLYPGLDNAAHFLFRELPGKLSRVA